MQNDAKVVLEDNPEPNESNAVAKKEDNAIAQRNYDDERKHNQYKREEDARNFVHRGFKFGTSIIAIIMVTTAVVFSIHQLAPESWRWLSKNDLENITFFGGGAIVALFLAYLRKYS